MSAGIDYGLGKANVDKETGIRYGVIALNSLHEFIYDDLESDYGEPSCPECGHTVEESPHGKDFFCDHCFDKADPRDGSESRDDHSSFCYWAESCYPDQAIGQSLNDGEYEAHDAFDGTCLFLTKSPYYTLAKFCSPCAPGAGDLDSPDEGGVKTFCFSHDYFDDEKAPYPVYRVSDNSLVEP